MLIVFGSRFIRVLEVKGNAWAKILGAQITIAFVDVVVVDDSTTRHESTSKLYCGLWWWLLLQDHRPSSHLDHAFFSFVVSIA